jgi:Trk K+ transport system NAD-binding subunit
VLVCCLGSLGQACLERLLAFDVPLRCLDLQPPSWQSPEVEARLKPHFTLGDMRLAHVLQRAGAAKARAVLLLGSESNANFEAALQVRLLNVSAEIVVRSSSQQASLGALLEERLPGMAVVDPLLLTAGAISTALRPGQPAASFDADGQSFRIFEGPLEDRRYQRPVRLPGEKSEIPPALLTLKTFRSPEQIAASKPRSRFWQKGFRSSTVHRLLLWGRRRSPLQLTAAALLVTLLVIGVPLFSQVGGWKQGLFVTLALLKGEYVDPVNVVLTGTDGLQNLSGWLIAGTLFYSLVGTLITSALVAIILERLLRERLGFAHPRKLRPESHPILLVEGGALALRVSKHLVREKQVVVRIDPSGLMSQPEERSIVYDHHDAAMEALESHVVSAVGLLSNDLITNLHGALAYRLRWPQARIAILAHAVGASEQLGELLGGVTVISTVDLVADAVVATAFGEKVEGVLQLRGANLLLVRYRIMAGDTLSGRNISRVENGYNVTAVSIWRRHHTTAIELPPPELVLAEGDQLLVLATLASLRRIELSQEILPRWRLRLKLLGSSSMERCFEVQQCLARWLGCVPGDVAHLLDGQEHHSPPLDQEISAMLINDLRRQGVHCLLEANEDSG